jgi:N-acetylglucosamine-6-phosphate deacetylase
LTKIGVADLLVLGDRLYRGGAFHPGWLAVRGGRVVAVGSGTPPPSRETLAAGDRFVVPGLVDLHVHGCGGADASTERPEELSRMANTLAALGTTSFLATLYPAPPPLLARRLATVRAHAWQEGAARVLGAHCEGPFVSPRRAGALDAREIRPPTAAAVRALLRAGEGCLRLVTIAPEVPGAVRAIRALAAEGVRASLGHTDATVAQAARGIEAGAQGATHLFNAMRPIHHREIGVAGACLLDPAVSCEIIADFHHVAKEAIGLALRTKGVEGIHLVSDGLLATGTRRSSFTAGGHRHRVRSGAAFVGQGRLSGSCAPLLWGVRNLVRTGLLPLADAVRLATTNPARVLGLEGTVGDLVAGAHADFLLLDESAALRGAFVGALPVPHGR